jgi:hypothetical protein
MKCPLDSVGFRRAAYQKREALKHLAHRRGSFPTKRIEKLSKAKNHSFVSDLLIIARRMHGVAIPYRKLQPE